MKIKMFVAFASGILACIFFIQFALPVINDICNKKNVSSVNVFTDEKTDPLIPFIPKELPNSKIIEKQIKELVVLASKKKDWRKNQEIKFDMHVSKDTFKLTIFKKFPVVLVKFCDVGGSGFCLNLDTTAECQKRYYAALLFAKNQLEKM